MDVLVLTAVCSVGLLVAAAIVGGWGRRERLPAPPAAPDAPASQSLLHIARTATVGMVGGMVAGVLVPGLGSRLVMRALAATSGDEAQGLRTDAEEVVGRITAGGTLGLVFFVGLLGGVVGGLLYVIVRRWLPARAWQAGLLFGLLLLVCTARLEPLSPENHDFAILRPTWLAVLLVAAVYPAFGLVVASLVERLDQGWSHHPASFAPLLLLLLNPIVAVIGLAIAGVAFAARKVDWRSSRVVGRAALAAAGGAGAVWFGSGIASILA